MKNIFQFVCYCLLLSIITPPTRGANILCLMGMLCRSHHIWNRSLMEALAQQGHNLTILSYEVDEKPNLNLHYLQIEEEEQNGNFEEPEVTMAELANSGVYSNSISLYDHYTTSCTQILRSKAAERLFNYPDRFKFDVVLHDFTCCQCLLGFVHRFNNPPLISMSAYNKPSYTTFLSGTPQFPAYVPILPLPYDMNMSLTQRANNLFWHGLDRFYRTYIYMPGINRMSKKFFGDDLPDLESIEQSTSVTFVNTDPAIDVPQPLLPSVIEVGGMHIKTYNRFEKLEKGGILEELLNTRRKIIYFSFGSSLRTDLMTPAQIEMFKTAFKYFYKYIILWKYESDDLKSEDNILIAKWFPQDKILSFLNTELFITHAGLLSTQEATYYGVPMLGIPFVADQHQNLQKGIMAGVATKLDYGNLSVTLIKDSILEMLRNPSYQDNANRRQNMFRNKLNPPLETAMFWVNYVIKNRGAEHLRTVLPQMPLWKLLMLDVVLQCLGILILLPMLLRRFYKFLFNKNIRKEKKD